MNHLTLLSEIALAFQNLDDFESRLNEILADIGHYMDVSRIYIFLHESEEVVSNTFEWCGQGIAPQKQHLQRVSNQVMPSFDHLLREEGYICSNDINTLPADMIATLAPQQIKSLVAYPLLINQVMIGFIGFDECRYQREWQAEELKILSTIAGLVSNAYQRKASEADLTASETNFRTFFETIDDLFIITDLEGYILHANQTLINKLGYTLGELIGTDIRRLQATDQQVEIRTLVNRLLEKELDIGHLEIESKTGQTFLVDSRVWIGTWNTQPCIYTISKDITKKMENLHLFSTIFASNPLPMMIVNVAENTVSQVNPEFITKTGYTAADILGKSVTQLDPLIDQDIKVTLQQKRRQGHMIKNEEVSVRRKDGQVITGLVSIEEIISQGEKSLLIVLVDITERVNLSLAVEENVKKLTHIIDGTRAGTWELDIQTGAIQCNDYWTELLGYSPEELAPITMQRWDEITHPADLAQAYRALHHHIDGYVPYYESEMRMKHKDGHWVWSQGRGKITESDRDGTPLKMFGTHTDISEQKQLEHTLRENERRFFLALDKTEAGLWDIDLMQRTIFLSPTWKQILGYADNDIPNTFDAWKAFVHPDDQAELERLGAAFSTGKTDTFESISRFQHKAGDWRWILIRGGVLTGDNGQPARLIGTNIDITQEQEQTIELEKFFTVNLDLLCITTLDGVFIKTNKAWEEILGYSSAELKGRNVLDFIHPDDIISTRQALADLGNQLEVTQFINRYIMIDGTYRFIEWRSNSSGDNIYAAARDVTERKHYEEEILDLSNRDPLTKTYNRRYILNSLEELMAHYTCTSQIFSICLIDIDDFKLINDTHGHQAGDNILQAFTKDIAANLRADDLLGRYGGEEFIIILKGADAEQSYEVIERILLFIRNKTFHYQEAAINFTFSAGLATCTELATHPHQSSREKINTLINRADQRMYQAKKIGKNTIVTLEP